MKKFIEWDYNTGQLKVNYDYIITAMTSKMLNIRNIWNEIEKREVKIITKENFNKSKTNLEYGEIIIKSKNSKSYIKLSLKEKGDSIKLKIEELGITEEEKNFFLNHVNECLYLLYNLLFKYYSTKVRPIKEEALKKLEKETEILRNKINS